MVTETERDDALAALLVRQVETSQPGRELRTDARPAGTSRIDRLRIGVTTGVVLVAVVAVTVLVLTLHRPTGSTPAAPTATPSSSRSALEDAVYARLSEVATGDVAVRDKSALTWTDASASPDGEGIDTTGKTLYLAAACAGGGSITISETGRDDTVLTCDSPASIGPIDLTPRGTSSRSASLKIVVTSGHPRYVAKSMAFPTPSATAATSRSHR